MAAVMRRTATALSSYRDQQFQGSLKEQEDKLKLSSTLYVGNLSFFTSEDQIYHLFAKAGDVKRVVMGLDRHAKTPCGFCFVEFYTREDAEDALRYVSGTRLDERIVRCDWDAGFVEGRQYGRGRSGGQVRDEFRTDYDAGRGGFGKMIQTRVERFGMAGPGGPDGPNRRFGKRKWQEYDTENAGDIPDLRQKLQRRSLGDSTLSETSDVGVTGPGTTETTSSTDAIPPQAQTETDTNKDADAPVVSEKSEDVLASPANDENVEKEDADMADSGEEETENEQTEMES